MAESLRPARIAPRVAELTSTVDIPPPRADAGRMLRSVAAIVLPNVAPFELGVACEVFGIDRRDTGGPVVRLHASAASSPGVVPHQGRGFSIVVEHGLEATRDVDLVVVPAYGDTGAGARGRARRAAGRARARRLGAEHLQRVVRARRGRAARRPAVHDPLDVRRRSCAAPVPDGAGRPRRALRRGRPRHHQRRHGRRHRRLPAPGAPRARRRRGVGRSPAGWSCRRTATAARRSTSTRPLPCDADTLAPLLAWMVGAPRARSSACPDLAARALVSERTFARRFRAETGTTPAAWVTRQRVVRAQELLERTDAGIEEIARLVRVRHRRGPAAPLRPHARHQPAGLPAHVRPASPVRADATEAPHAPRGDRGPRSSRSVSARTPSRRGRPARPGASWPTRRPATPTPCGRRPAACGPSSCGRCMRQERPRALVARLVLHPHQLGAVERRERRADAPRRRAGRAARAGRSPCCSSPRLARGARAGPSRPCPSTAARGSTCAGLGRRRASSPITVRNVPVVKSSTSEVAGLQAQHRLRREHHERATRAVVRLAAQQVEVRRGRRRLRDRHVVLGARSAGTARCGPTSGPAPGPRSRAAGAGRPTSAGAHFCSADEMNSSMIVCAPLTKSPNCASHSTSASGRSTE